MINALIALAIIAIFAIGLLCALGVIDCGASPDHPGAETK
jgi:hypothetical protein